MSQLQNTPTSLDLRSQLHQMVVKDLLGPAGGPDEMVDESSVRSRYVVGLLAPKGQTTLPDEHDELAQDGGPDDPQDGKPDAPAAPAPAMLPSSFGLTFSVSDQAQAVQVTARWGHYHRTRSETLKNQKGEPKLIWQRQQIESTSALIPLKVGKIQSWSPSPDFPEVTVRGLMRRYDSVWSVTLFLVNGQSEPKQYKDQAWLFQPELVIRAADGGPAFIKRPLNMQLHNPEPEAEAMQMAYRRQIEFAVGHGVGVHVERLPGDWEYAVEIRTAVIPSYEVDQVDAPRPDELPALKQVQLDMQVLGQTPDAGFAAALDPLADAYEAWITDQESRLDPPEPDLLPYLQSARSSLDACKTTLEYPHGKASCR